MNKLSKSLLVIISVLTCSYSYGQEKILSIGYAKTFVSNDSTALNISFDLNRIPGQKEKAGGYYFVNEVLKGKWGYYVKPSLDVNIGSSVSSAPNNISVGLPVGIVYDFTKTKLGIFSWYLEGSPELVADKDLTNNLYYFSQNTYLKYELLSDKILLNILLGITNANGLRTHTINDEYQSDSYGRLTFPIYSKVLFWNASNKRTVNGIQKGKDFKRIHWTNTLKLNHVYKDSEIINAETNYTFFSSKIDFYFIPNLALNVTYNNGNQEPVFKRNNSLSFGLTLAK